MTNINYYANNLKYDNKSCIWTSTKQTQVSYPDDGHEVCHEIEPESFWYDHRNRCIKEIFSLHDIKIPFFDIGGGNGRIAKDLGTSGFETVMLEPGIDGASNARKYGVENVICSTFDDAGFKENIIPAAGLFDVLEHIENDKGFLNQINKSLAPGGKLIITVPAYNFLWSANDNRVGHYRRYSLTVLKKLLLECNFSINYSTYLFSPMPLAVFLIRTLPYRLGIYRQSTAEKIKRELNPGDNIFTKTLKNLLRFELSCIKKNKTIPFGSTCLIVATTNNK